MKEFSVLLPIVVAFFIIKKWISLVYPALFVPKDSGCCELNED